MSNLLPRNFLPSFFDYYEQTFSLAKHIILQYTYSANQPPLLDSRLGSARKRGGGEIHVIFSRFDFGFRGPLKTHIWLAIKQRPVDIGLSWYPRAHNELRYA